LIATVVTVPVVIVIALLLGGTHDSGAPTSATPSGSARPLAPVTVAAPPANPAAIGPCTKLLAVLPIALDGLPSRPALSSSTFAVAWGDPAIVLRCGVPRPSGLVPGSSAFTTGVNGVFYWVDRDSVKGATVFTVIDRAVYIEVTVPSTYGGGPLAPISTAVSKALPAVCIVPGTDATQPAAGILCTDRP
jgi:hypothetical protein